MKRTRRNFLKVLAAGTSTGIGLLLPGTAVANDSIEDASATGSEEESTSPQGVSSQNPLGEYNDDPTPAQEDAAGEYADSLTQGAGGGFEPESYMI